jgi:hypothetical protein
MTRLWRTGVVAVAFLLLSACATSQATPLHATTVGDLRVAWCTDNCWRYHDAAETDAAWRTLLTRQSPWPEWHQPRVVTLRVGIRFQMALAPGQPVDRPGAFGTFERIPSRAFVRSALAVKVSWKPRIDRVVTYEVATPLEADIGMVGPQVDGQAHAYLPGGASQLEMKPPAAERFSHLRVVAVRELR